MIEIPLDVPLPWWPLAPGWKAVIGILLFGLALSLWRLGRGLWKNRYRFYALGLIRRANMKGRAVEALPFILKRTALHAYPRQDVASLSGESWLAFLDACLPERQKRFSILPLYINFYRYKPGFQSEIGRFLLAIAYQPPGQWQADTHKAQNLLALARYWIKTHKTCPSQKSRATFKDKAND